LFVTDRECNGHDRAHNEDHKVGSNRHPQSRTISGRIGLTEDGGCDDPTDSPRSNDQSRGEGSLGLSGDVVLYVCENARNAGECTGKAQEHSSIANSNIGVESGLYSASVDGVISTFSEMLTMLRPMIVRTAWNMISGARIMYLSPMYANPNATKMETKYGGATSNCALI
jgi:hypothetical protein